MTTTRRPVIYVRLFQAPKVVAPPAAPPATARSLEKAALETARREKSNAVSLYLGARADEAAGVAPAVTTDEEEAWKAREAARFDRETKEAAQQDSVSIDITDRVLSFRYEQEADAADLVQIVVANHDMREFDNPYWKKGNILEVTWGYAGDMTWPRRAKIVKIRGSQELTIEAHGIKTVMNEKKKTRTWTDTNLRKVIEEVLGEYKDEFDVVLKQSPGVLAQHDSIRKLRESVVNDVVTSAPAGTPKKYFPLLAGLAKKWGDLFGLDQRMIYTIIRIESSWNPFLGNTTDPRAIARGGAAGAMAMTLLTAEGLVPEVRRSQWGTTPQVVEALKAWDGTYGSLLSKKTAAGEDDHRGADLNVMLGTFYLADFWRKFGGDYQQVAAAYHAGPGPVYTARKKGVHVSETVGPKTKEYLAKADRFWAMYAGVGGTAAPAVAVPQLTPDASAAVTGVAPQNTAFADFLASQAQAGTVNRSSATPMQDYLDDLREEQRKAAHMSVLKRTRGFDALGAEKVKLAQVHQSAETDFQLVARLARKYGYHFYIAEQGFVFEEIDEVYRQPAEKQLTWYFGNGEFLEFTYENEGLGKSNASKKRGVNADTMTDYETKAGNAETSRAGSGAHLGDNSVIGTDWKQRTGETTRDLRVQIAKLPDSDPTKALKMQMADMIEMGSEVVEEAGSEDLEPSSAPNGDQAKVEADGAYKAQSSSQHQIQGKVIGDPAFGANVMIDIQGIGRRLSGKWKVRQVAHLIAEHGYLCSFQCERDGDNGFGEKGEADSKAAQNQEVEIQRVHEWQQPSGKRVDTAKPWVVRDGQATPQ